MTDIIKFEDNKPIISNEFKDNYKKFITLKEEVEKAQSIINSQMIEYFENLPEEERKPLDFETFKITYVKSTTRKTFDSKLFQDEHPELYNKFVKESTVKSSIRYGQR